MEGGDKRHFNPCQQGSRLERSENPLLCIRLGVVAHNCIHILYFSTNGACIDEHCQAKLALEFGERKACKQKITEAAASAASFGTLTWISNISHT